MIADNNYARQVGVFGRRKLPIIELTRAPLLGAIFVGILDRGTNVLQIRPHTLCHLSCVFCSVDAGPRSTSRQAEFRVKPEPLAQAATEIAYYKGGAVEALIDSVGDPLIYPEICELISALKQAKPMSLVSMETHGHGLTPRVIDKLVSCGLDRLNLSLDALDPKLARELSGTPAYNPDRIVAAARYATEIGLWILLTPVWVPGYNDAEIPKLIELAVRLEQIDKRKGLPRIAIQKYEAHKLGRKPKSVRPLRWRDFYSKLRNLEQEYQIKLVFGSDDMMMRRARQVKAPYFVGDQVIAVPISLGWRRGELLAVTSKLDRLITIVGVPSSMIPNFIGKPVPVTIIYSRNNVFLARL